MSTSKKQSKPTSTMSAAKKTKTGEGSKKATSVNKESSVYNTIKYYEGIVRELNNQVQDLTTGKLRVEEALRFTEKKNNELTAQMEATNENAAKENSLTIIHKLVIVEKLKNGFAVKEFKGERTTPAINRSGHVDVEKDVAASFEPHTNIICDGLVLPVGNLLDEAGAGAKYGIKVSVLVLPR